MPYVRVFLMLAVTAASQSHGRTQPDPPRASPASRSPAGPTATPIKHLIVIFQENHSFDAYFGTYPVAANPPGQPAFRARRGTPSVNGLTETLLVYNPNSSNPFRIDREQSYTCDQDHEYTAEQRARNGGLMNQFPRFDAQGPTNPRQFCRRNSKGQWDTLMGYFDGNTVTALWYYAQHFALSDNSYYVSHALTDQTSILLFIEDNWLDGARISELSFDRKAGSLLDMFALSRRAVRRLRLDPTTGLPRRRSAP